MSYATGEAQLLTTLRALSLYNNNNSARLDWQILNRGKDSVYAILRPGESTEEITGMGHTVAHVTYTTIIEVWQLYQKIVDATTLETNVETTRAHFRKYRFLGGGAGNTLDCQVTGVSQMLEKWRVEGGPRFVVQEINLQWQEQVAIVLAE